jgi:hypothetical protein
MQILLRLAEQRGGALARDDFGGSGRTPASRHGANWRDSGAGKTPVTDSLRGAVKLPPSFDEREVLIEELQKAWPRIKFSWIPMWR